MKLSNRVKTLIFSLIAVTALGLIFLPGQQTQKAAQNTNQNSSQFCGFNSNEQVQDVGTGGGLYGADQEGCITIVDNGIGNCSRFDLQPLSGTQS
jgi:hypothetical protein